MFGGFVWGAKQSANQPVTILVTRTGGVTNLFRWKITWSCLRCLLRNIGQFSSAADFQGFQWAASSTQWSYEKVSRDMNTFTIFMDVNYSPNSVSTLRGSYGTGKGRFLIRVLNLSSRFFPVNSRIKWLLCFVQVHFDCAGSRKMWVAVSVCGILLVQLNFL